VPEREIKDAKISDGTEDPTTKLPGVELLKLENSKIVGPMVGLRFTRFKAFGLNYSAALKKLLFI
jgi:hypothetical protein